MRDSKLRPTTLSSSKMGPSADWMRRAMEARLSKAQASLAKSKLTLPGGWPVDLRSGTRLQTICECGRPSPTRCSDLIKGKLECRSCASKRRMATPEMQAMATKNLPPPRPGDPEWSRLRKRMQVAKDRCVNPDNKGYKNYGGRGIEFRFASASEAAAWVRDNLGYPKAGHSLDRVDNMGHYEAGNLRWATRVEQNRNRRRSYTNSQDYKPVLDRLVVARPDYSLSSLRGFLEGGLTEDQILERTRYANGSNV